MSWFLNALHLAMNGTKKLSSTIVNKTFRGKMKVYTRKVLPIDLVRLKIYTCTVYLQITVYIYT